MSAPLLRTATIGKTHGLDGSLRVYSLSGDYSHLKKLDKCACILKDGEELTLFVEKAYFSGDIFLMKFKEYDSPERARFLSSSTISIERSKAPKLKKGEYYVADLFGMDVIYNGEKVASVEYTAEGGQSLLLSLRRIDNNKEYFVPLLPVYITNVNVDNNSLELIYPDLLEL